MLIVIELSFVRKRILVVLLLAIIALGLVGSLAWRVPSLQSRLSWRADLAVTYLRAVLNPAGSMPTALPQPHVAVTQQPGPTPIPLAILAATRPPAAGPSPTPTPVPTPIPKSISLAPPKWEKQDANNCGPTSLALYLRHYGWGGDQFTISDVIKPFREDRNVNVEELAYYVRNKAGWLSFEYRVGADLETLKRILAAGFPVMIEEGMELDQTYWPNDDKWAAHYLLLTGYDDEKKVFISQDTYYGADKKVDYQLLDKSWEAFNRVAIMIYPPDQQGVFKSIFGEQWDVDVNRQHALQVAEQETQTHPEDAFAWFNVGTNLAYFERYGEAASAYDQARNLGLPQRMLRYQFGPFMAYFHSGMLSQLDTLLKYALKITHNSEEALLWRGWMEYRRGDKTQALDDFRQSLEANPNYEDAKYALSFMGATP
jgi:tetratricopeptide (TPR) repeat protein